MAESKSIDQWQECVKSCNESGKSKAALSPANALNDHQFVMPPISQAAIKGELLGCSNHNFSNTQGGL